MVEVPEVKRTTIFRGDTTHMNTKTSTVDTPLDPANTEVEGFADDAVIDLLASTDDESLALLKIWLKENATTLGPLLERAAGEMPGLSGEASCVVLDALLLKPLADEQATTDLMNTCLHVIAARITESLSPSASGADNRHDDPLVSAAVAVVTSGRRSRSSETVVSCLATAGPGGSLVLARAFDTLRDTLKLYALRRLDPAEVLELGENVATSLRSSVSKLIESLEGKQRTTAVKFLKALTPEDHSESVEIDPTEPLEVGAHVFHATWGVGAVVKSGDGTVKVDFGSAGTRTLLRKFATLRHGA